MNQYLIIKYKSIIIAKIQHKNELEEIQEA